MSKVYNFSPGPAVLPGTVLQKAAGEMMNYRGTGISVLEMSHRSATFRAIIEKAESDLRTLWRISEDYAVLFVPGGATLQFAMAPINLFRQSRSADYINTGVWSRKAIAEASRFGTVRVVAGSEDSGFTCIPELEPEHFSADADFAHITTNNTITGTEFREIPDTGPVPLVADMSSNFLARDYDVTQFGLIYAGTQKNAGVAGVTIVIIRKDLVGFASPKTPAMLDYATFLKAKSLHNTPPVYAIYMTGLVLEWLLANGGLATMARKNHEKAGLIYDFLDGSQLFKAVVAEPHRSTVNIPFILPNETLNERFLAAAENEGLVNLRGHRSVGGMRASLYNAMPVEGVRALVRFMAYFETENLDEAGAVQ